LRPTAAAARAPRPRLRGGSGSVSTGTSLLARQTVSHAPRPEPSPARAPGAAHAPDPEIAAPDGVVAVGDRARRCGEPDGQPAVASGDPRRRGLRGDRPPYRCPLGARPQVLLVAGTDRGRAPRCLPVGVRRRRRHRRPHPVPAAAGPTTGLGGRRSARRAGLAGEHHLGRGRRDAARRAALLHRCSQRTGQPATRAARAARCTLRARRRCRRVHERRSAARREHRPGTPRQAAARRSLVGLASPARHRDPGRGGRVRTIASPRGSDGRPRLRPPRRGSGANQTAHDHTPPRGHGGSVCRDVRPARPHDARPARLPDDVGRRHVVLHRARSRWPAGDRHALPPGSLADAGVAGRRVGTVGRRSTDRRLDRGSRRPHPFSPLVWPSLPLLPTLALVLAALPAFAAPPPPAEARVTGGSSVWPRLPSRASGVAA
jgi:hypothetical protein